MFQLFKMPSMFNKLLTIAVKVRYTSYNNWFYNDNNVLMLIECLFEHQITKRKIGRKILQHMQEITKVWYSD